MGGWYHNPALFRGRLVEPLSESVLRERRALPGEFVRKQPVALRHVDDRWRFSVVTMDVGQDQNPVLRFGMQNESSKLHLANILRWEQATPGHGRLR